MSAPFFLGPDGVLRQDFLFTTTISQRFFTGTMDADTVDMQVSIRGSAFASNPDLISFEGTSFTVPNPSAYPDGLQLLTGNNVVSVKSIVSNGTASGTTTVTAVLSSDQGTSATVNAPTGVFIEKQDSTVQIFVEGLTDATVQGYHFYASPSPGGGDIGYFRINPVVVLGYTATENSTDLGILTTDANVALGPDGSHAADPLYLRMVGTQTNQAGAVIQTDFSEYVEVPETADRVRVQVLVQTIQVWRQYSFIHDRQATLSSANPALTHSELSSIPLDQPLYYVVTAVHLIEGTEIESAFSPEVAGYPLVITPLVGTFPTVTRQQITDAVVTSIYRSHPQMKIEPGSVVRDTFIDPFATEAQRIRFIVQFFHDAQSFATLLRIDDPSLTGTSVPVSQSTYKNALKQAFYLQSDLDVQTLIDNTFDKLASNFGIVRSGGQRAGGEVTFSVKTAPTTSLQFPIGTVVYAGGIQFKTTSSALISPTGAGSGYNPRTGRYYTRAYLQATQVGAAGNVSAGQIRSMEGNVLSVQVTNENATFGGRDLESNMDLATRAQGALSSVDTGTEQGYLQHARNVAGVSQAVVVGAGSDLMMRDVNSSGVHVGGKVDIWIRGAEANEARVTDNFAFGFEIVQHMQFEPVGDLADLIFRALDPRLSSANPIIEMMNYPAAGLEFENATQSYAFNLTGVTVLTYNQIQLSSTYNDPIVHLQTDIFFGAYRYRTSDRYVLSRQPPVAVESLSGDVYGILATSLYGLYRASDPLLQGRSSDAGDYVQMLDPNDGTQVPSATPIAVTGESHVILDGTEYVDSLGCNPYTLHIYNNNRTVEYYGPFNITGGVQDWRIVDNGSATTPLGIELTATSRITNGQTVLFDYSHDETFVVTYTYNSLIGITQSVIDTERHITADVQVKQAIETPVDIAATVVLQPRETRNLVDARIRTNLSVLFGSLAMGRSLYASDIIRVIDQTLGVDHVVTPARIIRGNGALVLRTPLVTETAADIVLLSAWSSPTVSVYLLQDLLVAPTSNAGGPATEFRGVFQDEVRLYHVENLPNAVGYPLRSAAGRAFILGNDGANIMGFSDDATLLLTSPLATASELQVLRAAKTGNRVAVSVAFSDTPLNYSYGVTYVVANAVPVSVSGIVVGNALEYLIPGTLEFTYP